MAAKEETVTEEETGYTAKLIRGNVYYYKGKRFEGGKDVEPTPVSKELAEELAEIVLVRTDYDGEKIEKKRFRVTGLDEDDEDGTPRALRRSKKPSRRTVR